MLRLHLKLCRARQTKMRLYPDLAANRICCSSRWWIRRQRHPRQHKPSRRAVKRKPHKIKRRRSSNWRASGKIFPPRRATCSMVNVAKWSNCTANWRKGSRAGWRDNRQSNTVKIVVMFCFFIIFLSNIQPWKKKGKKNNKNNIVQDVFVVVCLSFSLYTHLIWLPCFLFGFRILSKFRRYQNTPQTRWTRQNRNLAPLCPDCFSTKTHNKLLTW